MTMWVPDLSRSQAPRFLALAEALAEDVASGRLAPGQRLPAHRDLAQALRVTVGTVTRGYQEAARRGLVRGETGRGTFVAGAEPAGAPLSVPENPPRGRIDLGHAPPLSFLDPDLATALGRLAERGDVQELLRYQPSRGRLRDRETGARWMERFGLAPSPDNVLVCAGGQNAMLVVLSELFKPGDRVACDALTYPLFRTLARRLRLTPTPVPMDERGMIPEELAALCRTQTVRGLYLIPTCQNPTTRNLPDYRRFQLADLARAHDLVILEDDPYAVLVGEPAAPMALLAPERTFFVAALSKALAGALRIAFLLAPEGYAPRLERAISDFIWTAPALMAEIARMWIDDGQAETVIARKRQEAARRNALAREILGTFALEQRPGGLFAWLTLPEPWRALELEREAAAREVFVIPDERFAVGRGPAPHAVRLSLSLPERLEDLRRGLEILRDILS